MANEVMRELWTNRAGPAWFANHDIFEAVFEPSRAVITAVEPLAGRVVLDGGRGTGGRSPALLDDVRAEVRTRMVDGAVRFPGCIWVVRAAAAT